MAATVDERIVAAKFDASDFEKGVNKTIKKLDELKKSLNLTDTAKSIKETAEKTEESTNSMSGSLEKLTERFTTFTGMIKQKILGGLADEVANVFLRMEQSVKSFIKSISSDQVGNGLYKYYEVLTAVRVMDSAGVGQSKAYESIEDINEYVKETSYSLTQMTDALSKMVAAGVNVDDATKSVQGIANACADAGVNAQDAQRAFYNLAQAYGKGKLEFTDYKSLELLNMTTATFKQNLLDAAVEVGTLKKLQKEGEYQITKKAKAGGGVGKKVNVKNLTDMMRYDFITNDVMDKVFGAKYYFSSNELLSILQNEMGLKVKSVYDDEAIAHKEEALEIAKKKFGEVAVRAYEAAKEARSFTDVINTLKDYVSTGWAKTFELLFGKLDEAKKFFTELTEGPLANSIYLIGDWRNAVLGAWNDSTDGIESGGGAVLRQTILHITNALGELLKTLLQILPGFSEMEDDEDIIQNIGHRLFEISMTIRDFSRNIEDAATNFNKFMNESIAGGPSRIELLRSVFANLGAVFSVVGQVIDRLFKVLDTTFYSVISPIMDGVLIFLSTITKPLTDLSNNTEAFDDLENSGKDLAYTLEPIATFLGKIIGFLGKIGEFIVNFAITNFTSELSFIAELLGLISEVFTGKSAQEMEDGVGILGKIEIEFNNIVKAGNDALAAINEFFDALLGDLRTLFGLTDNNDSKNDGKGGIFANLTQFFETNQFVQDAKAWVNQAIIDVGDFIKSLPDKIFKFGANIYDTIWHLFFYEKREDVGGEMKTNVYKTELGEWLDNTINSIVDFVLHIPDKIIEAIGTIGSWIDYVFDLIMGDKKLSTNKKEESKDKEKSDANAIAIKNRFSEFLSNTIESIKKWFADLPTKISTGLSNVGDFFTRVINALTDFLFGKKVTRKQKVGVDEKGKAIFKTVTVRYKSGFSKWLDGFIKEVKKFIHKIPSYIRAGLKGAGDIISAIVNAIFGKDENSQPVKNKDVQNKIEEPFLNIDLSNILESIKSISSKIINWIASIFTGSEDVQINEKFFSDKIAEGIKWIREKAETALQWVLNFFSSLPTKIANFFKSEGTGSSNAEGSQKGPIGTAISEFAETVGNFIAGIPWAVLSFFNNAISELGGLWERLYNALIGKEVEGTKREFDDTSAIGQLTKDNAHRKSNWDKFVEELGKLISTAFENLPTWIAEGIHIAIVGLDGLLSNITEWLNGESTAKEIQDAAEKAQKEAEKGTVKAAEGIAKGTEDAAEKVEGKEDENPLLTAIKGIGQSLYTLIVTTIPGFLSAAWTWLGSAASSIWDGISSIFEGEPTSEEKEATSEAAKNGIQEFLKTTLPNKIAEIWKNLRQLGIDIWNGVTAIFTGKIPESKRAMAITNIGLAIKDIISSAIKGIGDLFNKKDPVEEALEKSNVTDGDAAYFKRYADKMKKDSKKANEDVGKSFLSSILGVFADIAPLILNGLSVALDFLSDLGEMIINQLTGGDPLGKQIDKAYGKDKPELKKSLIKIGESLKRFFLDTIPNLLGSAIGILIGEAPEWFGKLFNGIEKGMDEAAKQHGVDANSQQNKEENQKSIFDNIISYITTFVDKIMSIAGNDMTLTIGVILAIAFLINQIRDVFTLADEIDNLGYTIKWAGIAIAITAIAGILGSISDMVKNGTPDQIERFDKVIDRIKEMLDKVKEILYLVTAGKLIDAIGDSRFLKAKTTIEGGSKLKNGLIESVNGFFTNFFGAVGIGAGIDVGGRLAGAGLSQMLESITDEVRSGVGSMNDILNDLFPMIDTLDGSSTKLDNAIEVAKKIGKLFEAFYTAFSDLFTSATGKEIAHSVEEGGDWYSAKADNGKYALGTDKAEVSIEAFIESLQTRIGVFYSAIMVIEKIVEATSKIDNVDDIQTKLEAFSKLFDADKDVVSMFVKMFNIVNTALNNSNLSNVDYDGKESELTNLSIGLDILADAFSIISSSMAGLDIASVHGFSSALDIIARLATAISGSNVTQDQLSKAFKGNHTLSKIGFELKQFGQYVQSFYTSIKDLPGFKEDEMAETTRKTDSIIKLVRDISGALANYLTYGRTSDMIQTVTEELPGFADTIARFFNSVNAMLPRDISVERSEVMLNAVNMTSNLIAALGELRMWMMTSNTEDISKKIQALYTALMDNQGTGSNLYKLSASIKLLHDAIASAMKNEENLTAYEEAGDAIARHLFNGIQKAFDNNSELVPKIKIEPIIDVDNLKGQLSMLFGEDYVNGINWNNVVKMTEGSNNQVDEDRVTNTSLTELINSIKGDDGTSLKSLKESQATASDLTKAFAGMQITIDKTTLIGEIVDGIDEAIGNKIVQIIRGLAMGPNG